jgi:hypothetical protein
MKALEQLIDPYDRKARLYPSLLLLAPLAVLIAALLSAKYSGLQALAAGAVSCGGAFLLTQLARDAGKKLEPKLFDLWGGLPSVAIFRHADNRLDAITKARYHQAMASLLKQNKPPTENQERENPRAADEVYAAWSNYLRAHTRDQKKFPLLFKENVNYGYRRNVLGLRPFGISITLLVMVIAVGRVCWIYYQTGQIDQTMTGVGLFSFVLLLMWVLRVSREWVRVPADAYAHRLVEAVDMLPASKSQTKR